MHYGKQLVMRTDFVPKVLILDVDGVLTDGKIYYGQEGKMFKVFGADDHEALLRISEFLEIQVVTADFRGYSITKRRVETDMKFSLELVSSSDRPKWVKQKFTNGGCIYMGDGIYDWKVFEQVDYGIAPANAYQKTREQADFVTERRGAEGAVSQACDHILQKFFMDTL
jgi:3-deoxy-D-manno-octulosonate 8-phosphate phosphatase (KDO 8-P phosphatase)